MYKAIIWLTLIFGCASFAFAQQQQTGIIVSDTATVQAKPDIAIISFGVSTQDKDPAVAARENARITNAVIDSLMKAGIAKKDIETARYSVAPMMDYRPSPPVITGYQVTNTVTVKQRNIDKAGELIDVGVKAGANNVQGVTFTLEDNTAQRKEALAKAVGKARAKAQVMADALGVKLGRVITASESVGFTPRPMYEMSMAKSAEAPTPIMPGDVEVSASVSLTYGIL